VARFGPIGILIPVGAFAVAWAAIAMPGVLLAAFLMLPYYKAQLSRFSPVDLTVLLALVNAAQFAIIPLLGRFEWRGSRLGLGLWAALGLIVLAGVIWAGDQPVALDRAAVWWALIAIPSIAAIRVGSDPRFVNHFLATMFVIGTVIVVVGLPAISSGERFALNLENTIQTGQVALLTALISLTWFIRAAPRLLRPLAAVIVPVALIEAIASGSRGPVLACGAVLVFAVARRVIARPTLSRQDLGAVIGVVALAAAALVLDRLPGQSLARFGLLGSGAADTSATARVDLFNAAAEMFGQAPILGHGTGSFGAFAHWQPGFTAYTYPHNILVQIAAELGIVGLAVGAAFLAVALLRPIVNDPAGWTLRVLGLFMVINSLISGDIYSDRLTWGLLVLLVAAAPALPGRQRTAAPATMTAQVPAPATADGP
jgi:O-antigen ligase